MGSCNWTAINLQVTELNASCKRRGFCTSRTSGDTRIEVEMFSLVSCSQYNIKSASAKNAYDTYGIRASFFPSSEQYRT